MEEVAGLGAGIEARVSQEKETIVEKRWEGGLAGAD